jgi:hypothetical protein
MKITVLFAMGLVVLAGCAPFATYPPEQGMVELSGPTIEPIPTLMTESIRYAQSRYGDSAEEFAINLPPQTPPAVYETVIRRLGEGHPQLDADEPAYHVTSVRARGLTAQVDLFYPRADGFYEFVTISFRRDLLRGYEVQNTRFWRTDDQPPEPNYRPQAAETTVAAPADAGD